MGRKLNYFFVIITTLITIASVSKENLKTKRNSSVSLIFVVYLLTNVTNVYVLRVIFHIFQFEINLQYLMAIRFNIHFFGLFHENKIFEFIVLFKP